MSVTSVLRPNALAADSATRLPRWVNTALAACIGVTLAATVLKLLPADITAPQGTPSATDSTGRAAPDPRALGQRIASLHLFGDVAAKPVAAVERTEPIEETRLNLQLAGVYAADPEDQAIAIISAGSAEQNAYGIGDRITPDTILKAVFSDHVVLNNRGRDEILKLPEDSQQIALAPIRSSGSDDSASDAGPVGEDFSQPVALPSNPGELRDTLARNPSMLGRVVSAEPYQENGKLVGYRITPKQNPEILEAQGIVAGDVITRVNDIQLNSQKQGIRALRNAVKADNLEVTVLRGGVEIPLSISLSQ